METIQYNESLIECLTEAYIEAGDNKSDDWNTIYFDNGTYTLYSELSDEVADTINVEYAKFFDINVYDVYGYDDPDFHTTEMRWAIYPLELSTGKNPHIQTDTCTVLLSGSFNDGIPTEDK